MHNAHGPTSPTAQAYGELQTAYNHFNCELFAGELPACLITLQRKGGKKRRTFGYFSSKRFANVAGNTTDEIALNPRHFRHRSFFEVMSTLVHEMVHLWQYHFGKPSRAGYHNRQWAGQMLRIGLHPSNTGGPGGRMVGQQMTHYIVADGPFETAAKKLLASPLGLSWFDADSVVPLPSGLDDLVRSFRTGQRTKFQCPGCGDQAWGKPSLNLLCIDCERQLEPANFR